MVTPVSPETLLSVDDSPGNVEESVSVDAIPDAIVAGETVAPDDTFVMDQSQQIIEAIEQREPTLERQERLPVEGIFPGDPGYEFNEALKASPSLRRDWLPIPEGIQSNTFTESLWNAVKRDSFGGNIYREFDQQIAELSRSGYDEKLIWDDRENLTKGISPAYHDNILLAPTYGLAKRESRRIREREVALRKEYRTSIGQTLAADILGFFVDPSNYLPGYGMLRAIRVADRVLEVSLLKGIAASGKGKKMAVLAGAGAFEEAIRMAPRYTSDPTFEANNYYESIAMSAAFAGFLPVVFGGFFGASKFTINKMPVLHDDIQRNLHKWGLDVAVRQAMRFPGKLKEQGFKDPGTALRKAKEAAQDRVAQKVKGFDKTGQKRKLKDAVKQDMKGDVPGTVKLMGVINDTLDSIGEAVTARIKSRLERTKVSRQDADLDLKDINVADKTKGANTEEYLKMAEKVAIKQRQVRRLAYDAAVSAGDTKAARKILKDARKTPSTVEVTESYLAIVLEAVEKAKAKLKEVNDKAKRC